MRQVRWRKLGDFNPNSSQQILSYLTFKGYPTPRHRTRRKDGERAVTTDKESIAALLKGPAAGDRVLELIQEAKHITKALAYLSGNYIHPDGKLHPIIHQGPTERLASRSPNVMNFPKEAGGEIMSEASRYILRGIIAENSDFCIVSADWNSLHPSLIASFAGDPDYARVARLGDHAFILSHFLGVPVDLSKSDEEVKAELSELKAKKPSLYKIVKVANLAGKYLQGAQNMSKTLGLNLKDTMRVREAINNTFPKVTIWKWQTLLKAHSEGILVSVWGLPRKFLDIFRVVDGVVKFGNEPNPVFPQGAPVLGVQAPEAAAFLPLATESGMLRKTLVALFEHPECLTNPDNTRDGSFRLVFPEHDKIILEVRTKDLDRLLKELILPCMTRAWPELGGLRVGVDVEVGQSLGTAKTWKGEV